jgi:uncharacterized protein YdhG (YjbR/CyaY superfamily)
MEKIASIHEYISNFPPEIQKLLNQLRETIQKAAPEATEKISYNIPTFYLSGNLVHFAAYKNHIGFYPAPSALKKFEKELKDYPRSKGAVQFLLDKPLPLELITKMVAFRVKENLQKAAKQKRD